MDKRPVCCGSFQGCCHELCHHLRVYFCRLLATGQIHRTCTGHSNTPAVRRCRSSQHSSCPKSTRTKTNPSWTRWWGWSCTAWRRTTPARRRTTSTTMVMETQNTQFWKSLPWVTLFVRNKTHRVGSDPLQASTRCGTRASSLMSTFRSWSWFGLWWRTTTRHPRMIWWATTACHSPVYRAVRKCHSWQNTGQNTFNLASEVKLWADSAKSHDLHFFFLPALCQDIATFHCSPREEISSAQPASLFTACSLTQRRHFEGLRSSSKAAALAGASITAE